MNASQFSVLALAIAAIALVLLVAFCLQSFQYRKRTEQTLETLRQQVASVSAQSKDVGHQVEEQQNRSLVQSKHIQQLQEEITGFNNQIREVKLQDPSMRMYQRAAELVKQGASLEEVMESCDIPRAEAELIVTIHKK